MIPKSLRTWFLIHFIADYLVAVPLFLFPVPLLTFFGWDVVDPVSARLVAAALFAIGGMSLVSRGEGREFYRNFLLLKIIWSLTAILGFLLSIFSLASTVSFFVWVALFIFILFSLVWLYYYFNYFRHV